MSEKKDVTNDEGPDRLTQVLAPEMWDLILLYRRGTKLDPDQYECELSAVWQNIREQYDSDSPLLKELVSAFAVMIAMNHEKYEEDPPYSFKKRP